MSHLADDTVQAVLATLELEPEDAWALFRLLDKDVSLNIDAEEFVKGCLRLKGSARSIDLAMAMHDQQMIKKQNIKFMHYVVDQLHELRQARPMVNSPLAVQNSACA